MGVMERTKLWRSLGLVLNSRVGTHMAEATSGLVNKLAALGPTPKLAEELPWTPLRKGLRGSTVTLVSTGGFYLEGDAPFDVDNATGDASFREIPADSEVRKVRIAHTHYSHRYVDEDLNVLFPLERLRELSAAGTFHLARRLFSFGFGGMLTRAYVQKPDGTAHHLVEKLREDGVDLALIVPA